jgi:hypothetical protein
LSTVVQQLFNLLFTHSHIQEAELAAAAQEAKLLAFDRQNHAGASARLAKQLEQTIQVGMIGGTTIKVACPVSITRCEQHVLLNPL